MLLFESAALPAHLAVDARTGSKSQLITNLEPSRSTVECQAPSPTCCTWWCLSLPLLLLLLFLLFPWDTRSWSWQWTTNTLPFCSALKLHLCSGSDRAKHTQGQGRERRMCFVLRVLCSYCDSVDLSACCCSGRGRWMSVIVSEFILDVWKYCTSVYSWSLPDVHVFTVCCLSDFRT